MPSQPGSADETITVRSFKYDGTEHRRWRASLLRRASSLIELDATFDEEVRHTLLGTILPGTRSIEYYWLDRWYNVFRFLTPTGELRNYYCNVNVPPVFDGRVLSYIDLDMDILVAPDLSFSILDEDEFEMNAARYHYPPQVRRRARRALPELVALIESRRFPFDDPRAHPDTLRAPP
jgi:protein associated with RNAse G/E